MRHAYLVHVLKLDQGHLARVLPPRRLRLILLDPGCLLSTTTSRCIRCIRCILCSRCIRCILRSRRIRATSKERLDIPVRCRTTRTTRTTRGGDDDVAGIPQSVVVVPRRLAQTPRAPRSPRRHRRTDSSSRHHACVRIRRWWMGTVVEKRRGKKCSVSSCPCCLGFRYSTSPTFMYDIQGTYDTDVTSAPHRR